MLSNLVYPQAAFIKGRQISDSALIANAIVHGLKVGKMEGQILKLDFVKAFDSISWAFLFEYLRKINFGIKWVLWLESIFKSIRISFLVNGSPTREFSPKRGLCQGVFLSSLLVLIVGEILNCMLL